MPIKPVTFDPVLELDRRETIPGDESDIVRRLDMNKPLVRALLGNMPHLEKKGFFSDGEIHHITLAQPIHPPSGLSKTSWAAIEEKKEYRAHRSSSAIKAMTNNEDLAYHWEKFLARS